MEKARVIIKPFLVFVATAAIGAAVWGAYYDGRILFEKESFRTGMLEADHPDGDMITKTVEVVLKNRGFREIKIYDIIPSCTVCTRITCPDIIPAMGEAVLSAKIEMPKYRIHGQTVEVAVKSEDGVFTFEIVAEIGNYYSIGEKHMFFNRGNPASELNIEVRSAVSDIACVKIPIQPEHFNARMKSVDNSRIIEHSDGTQSLVWTFVFEISRSKSDIPPTGRESMKLQISNGKRTFTDTVGMEWDIPPPVRFSQNKYVFPAGGGESEIVLIIDGEKLKVSEERIGKGFTVVKKKKVVGQIRYTVRSEAGARNGSEFSVIMNDGNKISTSLHIESGRTTP